MIKAKAIFEVFHASGLLESMSGPDNNIERFDAVEDCTGGSLVFVDSADYLDQLSEVKPQAIVTHSKLAETYAALSSTAVLTTQNVRLAQALIRQQYADFDHRDDGFPQVHASAVIHDTANIAADVVVGAGVVIGRNVNVGSGSVIKANSVIEQDVSIGCDCLLYANVVIAQGCQLGDRVILKSGCVIGMEGFGFAQDKEGRSHRIPQTGRVVIEDDVSMGSHCNVDRSTWGETRIRAGGKFDAHCHIAHNVDIGEDCIMVAQSGVAGSVKLGRRNVISGQCAITDHVSTCDDVTLVQRAGVINNIEEPGVYAGTPIQPVKDYFRNSAVAHKLVELRKQVRQLEKQLASLSDTED